VEKSQKVQFSILCATYNRSTLLRRAIESVLKQEFKDFELIIISDGSTDNTREVVQSFKDARVKYVELEKNKGINVARNAGYVIASGRYLALLDDDDELAPYALQLAFDTFKRVKQKLLFFNCLDVEVKQINGKFLPEPRIITYADLLSQKLKGDYWVVVERCVLPNEKVFDNKSGGAGYTWLRVLQSNNAYYSPKIAYYAYREHHFQRITNYRSWEKRELNAEKVFREFGGDMKLYCPVGYSKQAAILAFYQIINNKKPQARANIFLSLRNRLTPYAFALLVFSFLGSTILLMVYLKLKKQLETSHF
jgi:glycosyltransferase involved in cell wall biosynthesis